LVCRPHWDVDRQWIVPGTVDLAFSGFWRHRLPGAVWPRLRSSARMRSEKKGARQKEAPGREVACEPAGSRVLLSCSCSGPGASWCRIGQCPASPQHLASPPISGDGNPALRRCSRTGASHLARGGGERDLRLTSGAPRQSRPSSKCRRSIGTLAGSRCAGDDRRAPVQGGAIKRPRRGPGACHEPAGRPRRLSGGSTPNTRGLDRVAPRRAGDRAEK
jgi:hypothetical protein